MNTNLFCLVPVLLVLLMVPLGWYIVVHNRFIALRNHLTESWAGIDVELKRRYDLIPNLVATVRGYASHERELFEEVVAARTRAVASVGTPVSQSGDERQLVACLGRLLAVAEGYPELKADRHFLELQEELVNTEDRLAAARRFYNGNVRAFNTLCHAFPTSIVARLGSFRDADFFEVDPVVRREAPPAVS